MNYYQRHLGDYAAQAGYLSALEHGVYTLLLDWYHKNERAIPDELAYQISKAGSRSEKRAVEKVLKAFFSSESGQGWRHEGAEAAIAKMREISKKKRAASIRRWHHTDMHVHSDSNADALLTNNQYPRTNTDSVESLSLIPNVGRKGPVPVSDLLKTFGQPDRSRR